MKRTRLGVALVSLACASVCSCIPNGQDKGYRVEAHRILNVFASCKPSKDQCVQDCKAGGVNAGTCELRCRNEDQAFDVCYAKCRKSEGSTKDSCCSDCAGSPATLPDKSGAPGATAEASPGARP